MSYSITRFKKTDWDEIEPREELKLALEEIKTEVIIEEAYTNGMPIFTLRYNDKIVCIYGFMYGGGGTYLPSLLPSKDVHKHTKKLIQLFYEYFATYVPRNARRMEAYCDIMDAKAIRLAKHFGFTPIGVRHNATPEGHDQVILERLTTVDPRKVMR